MLRFIHWPQARGSQPGHPGIGTSGLQCLLWPKFPVRGKCSESSVCFGRNFPSGGNAPSFRGHLCLLSPIPAKKKKSRWRWKAAIITKHNCSHADNSTSRDEACCLSIIVCPWCRRRRERSRIAGLGTYKSSSVTSIVSNCIESGINLELKVSHWDQKHYDWCKQKKRYRIGRSVFYKVGWHKNALIFTFEKSSGFKIDLTGITSDAGSNAGM